MAPQFGVVLCPGWPRRIGDLDLLPLHRVPPKAPRSKRMQRNYPVVPSDGVPTCAGRKHQSSVHRLSGGTFEPCAVPRGPVLTEDPVFSSGCNALHVCGSVVLWSHGGLADGTPQPVVQLPLRDGRYRFRGLPGGPPLLQAQRRSSLVAGVLPRQSSPPLSSDVLVHAHLHHWERSANV